VAVGAGDRSAGLRQLVAASISLSAAALTREVRSDG
jgi:hypothetical protein